MSISGDGAHQRAEPLVAGNMLEIRMPPFAPALGGDAARPRHAAPHQIGCDGGKSSSCDRRLAGSRGRASCKGEPKSPPPLMLEMTLVAARPAKSLRSRVVVRHRGNLETRHSGEVDRRVAVSPAGPVGCRECVRRDGEIQPRGEEPPSPSAKRPAATAQQSGTYGTTGNEHKRRRVSGSWRFAKRSPLLDEVRTVRDR